MYIETITHNFYSYLRQTGEIVNGVVDDSSYVWSFAPTKPFSALPEVEMFVLGITEECNLRCTYCCYSGKYPNNRTHGSRHLDSHDIDEIFDFIDNTTHKRPIYLAFYGGEPLMQYDLVQYAITKAEERWNGMVNFSLNTNATLLTNKKTDWLVQHDVHLEISVDGTESFHDRHRVDQTGKGSFTRVRQALKYLQSKHPEHLSKTQLLMTLSDISALPAIAEEWHNDSVLKNIAPSHITSIAPNSANEITPKDFESLKEQHLKLLDLYVQHPNWLVLKTYLFDCIADWHNRPIVDAGSSVPMPTCMPLNTKLYIDANKQVAVCEKISDCFRIGSVNSGIDWSKANELVQRYYQKRVNRCAHCPAILMCDLCLTAIEFNDEQWDVLCHNERAYVHLYMFLYCEMAERGLLPLKEVPSLHTSRCELREIHEADIPRMMENFHDVDTQRFLPELHKVVKTEDEMKQFLSSCKNALQQNEGILWGIFHNEALIGFIGITDISTEPAFYYAIHPDYRNQGFMTEAMKLILIYTQETKLCSTLQTEVYKDNIASQSLLNKHEFLVVESNSDKLFYKKELSD